MADSVETGLPGSSRRTRVLASGVIILIGLRFLSFAMPLAHDEGYYWLWSTHLAGGYFDHPPAIAFMIRLGVSVFGKTEFGVRVVGLLLAIPTTLIIWRAASLVVGRNEDGARAALFFNATLMANGQITLQSPDGPALFCAAAYMCALLELVATGAGYWWIVAGVSAGLGLLSKYTMFMIVLSSLLWVLWTPEVRGWLRSPWPWAGAVVATVIFLPNLIWNFWNGWPTFIFQFGRVVDDSCSGSGCGYPGGELLRFIATQLAMLSPLIAGFAAMGLWRGLIGQSPARRLLAASAIPPLAYFCVHALHAKVHDNWPSFVYPALSVAAADAFRHSNIRNEARLIAIPFALIMLAACYVQVGLALSGFPGRNFMGDYIAFNMNEVSARIREEVAKTQARAIATVTYPSLGWLKFYGPSETPIIEIGEDYRYPGAATPTSPILSGPILLVDNRRKFAPDPIRILQASFARIELLDVLGRRGTRDIFRLYRLDGFHGDPLGRIPYPDSLD